MSLQLKSYSLGALQTNCYLLWDDETFEAVVIDPADSGDFIIEQILDEDLLVKAIWLTHGHFDHVLGLLEVKLAFNAPVWMHQADESLLSQAQKSAQHWLERKVDPVPPADHFWKDNDQVELGSHSFKIFHTPGHTPGSVSLYSAQNQLLISGDTLFKGTIGRTDFSYSDHQAMLESLTTLHSLPAQTKVYPGHGDNTTIGSEESTLIRS
jgi:hydroxyacylglutathione hydrolase